MKIKNTLPEMAGQRVVAPNGHPFKLDQHGEATVPDDCGIHLAGKEWLVVQGRPKAVIVERAKGQVQIQAADGPLVIIQGPGAEVAGQKVTAPNGAVLLFNERGYSCAPDNCGILSVPGYKQVEPATEAAIAAYRVERPTTLEDLRQDTAVYLDEEDEEEDPYEALMQRLAGAAVVPTADGGPEGENEADGEEEGDGEEETDASETPVTQPTAAKPAAGAAGKGAGKAAKTPDPVRSERAKRSAETRLKQQQAKKAAALAAAQEAAGTAGGSTSGESPAE